ncbi:MAG: sigma-54 factor interaction domain-containing protein, partial [Proteobacteria bacterium]|nr:sigma-54 factor interaction domain-containing protein [Pseudomonadota bacterium]
MERRHGGESGIASVQCLVGEDAWNAMDRGAWERSLMQAALQVCDRATPGDARSLAPDASAFLINYRDGTRAMAMIPETVTPQWAIAADVTLPGADTVSRIAFRFGMGTQEPFSHFAWLIEGVQDMIETGVPTVPAIRTLLRTIERVAQSDAPVLITGETGTGKELVARAIHLRSRRGTGPMIAVNCGAIAPTLMQSELFGHERHAFTGAFQRRIGSVEAAHGGALFLDEIGELALPLQPALLRVLQDRSVTRLGSTTPVAIDFRLLAATHVDLAGAVADGRFR